MQNKVIAVLATEQLYTHVNIEILFLLSHCIRITHVRAWEIYVVNYIRERAAGMVDSHADKGLSVKVKLFDFNSIYEKIVIFFYYNPILATE